MDKSLEWQRKKPNPTLQDLEVMIGEWDMLGNHPMLPEPVTGHSSFGWLEEGAFFYWRPSYRQPGPPSAIAIVGRDDSVANYCMLYFDERGVSRIYQMSFEGRTWKLWRDSQGFWQRMSGKISDDLNTIELHGEKSSDGSHWEQDLDVTFTRIG